VTVQLELVERRLRRRGRRGAYHLPIVDGARGRAFIGRADELERLVSAYTRAADGDPWTVIVAGEAGIGKTRLVRAFSESVTGTGGRVMAGGCLPLGAGGLPYGPLAEAIRALVRDVDPAALPALLGPGRAELGRLMPELRLATDRGQMVTVAAQGEAPRFDATEDRFAQARLFELVLGLVGRLARLSPVALIVEDLQWADPSTRDLVAFLVRNVRDERVLLVTTIRTDGSDTGGTFLPYLAEIERGDRVDRIDLPRFGREDLMALMTDELGAAPDPELVDRTLERSGGNPFFAEQILAVSDETTPAVLPARLRDVLLARVAAVSDTGREILRVASAAGSRVDDDLLATVSDLPPSAVREGLREAIDRRILVSSSDASDGSYVFTHALLREVIHASLLPGERARLHARFAEALESRERDRSAGQRTPGPRPTPAEIADHWQAAGDDSRALVATVDAALAAERAAAFPDAHRRYLTALELWDRVPDAAPALDRPGVLVRAAETAVLIGEYRVAVGLGERAIALVDSGADPARAASLHERQRWYLWEAGDHAAAAAAVEAAERLVPEDPPSAARARILAHRAGLLMLAGQLPESIPYAEEAVALARTVGSRSDEALALGVLGWDLALLGRVDDGVDRVREGLAIADELGGTEGIALGASNLATLLDRVGRTREALEVARQGWDRIHVLGVERTYGGLILAIAAKAAIALGSWDEADDLLRIGRARRPIGPAGLRLRIQRCRLDTFRGDLGAAASALADGSGVDRVTGTEDTAPLLAATLDLAVAEGRVSDARAIVAEGFGLAAAGLPDPALASLAATALRLEADLAAAARARRDEDAVADGRARVDAIIGQVERIARTLRVSGATSDVAPTRDRAMAALCRTEAARFDERDGPAQWATVAGAFDAIERPYPAAYARYREAAATLRDRGPRQDAATALGAARTTADRLRAAPLLAEIDRLARQARLDIVATHEPAARDQTSSAPIRDLTEREVEVLGLIAAGWSNQEIADALFISRKTASVHASHIFDKLGAANRIDAAAIARRLGIEPGAPPPGGR
jgi:DNA-binding CsgD family transcriptional regulator/tetratricopeptide (TPR) repeat protein